MRVDETLLKLYEIYDKYLIKDNARYFLKKTLLLVMKQTNSKVGFMTTESATYKELLKKSILKEALLLTSQSHKKTSLQIIKMDNQQKNYYSPFNLIKRSKHSYTYMIKNYKELETLEILPIHVNIGNPKESTFYFFVLGNRQGGYSPALKKKLSLIMRTCGVLLSKYEAKKESQTQKKLLKQTVKHVPAAVAIFDKEMRYVMTSQQWLAEEVGLPTKRLENKLHYDVVKDIPERWKKIHQECLKGTKLRRKEEKFIRADGSIEWLGWEVQPWYHKTQVAGLLMFLSHRTEAKKSEEELRKIINDLEESKAQIERFVYMCSHDLKEPLRTIYTFLQLIKNESPSFISPQITEYYDFIFDGIQRMRELIENLLLHSELGIKNLQPETFRLSEIVDVVTKNNAHYAIECNAKIVVKNDFEIYADKFLITQLLHNLVSNAFKYARNNSPRVQVGGTQSNEKWKIYVKDNGIGINEIHHTHIFYEFNKIDKNNDYTSNGIGLAICKSIVEKHKGKIWVTSKEGKGSTFFFTIPKSLKNEPSLLPIV
jgi:PAS domain S-box-containing protein